MRSRTGRVRCVSSLAIFKVVERRNVHDGAGRGQGEVFVEFDREGFAGLTVRPQKGAPHPPAGARTVERVFGKPGGPVAATCHAGRDARFERHRVDGDPAPLRMADGSDASNVRLGDGLEQINRAAEVPQVLAADGPFGEFFIEGCGVEVAQALVFPFDWRSTGRTPA